MGKRARVTPAGSRTYLGTSLAPADYYGQHAGAYANPHASGVAKLLAAVAAHLRGVVLDLGCGDGLATKWLQVPDRCPAATGYVGVDAAPGMVARYVAETGCPGHVAAFGEALPACDAAIASYAMHLATPEEAVMVWWQLAEAGARTVVVIGPFKERPAEPEHYYRRVDAIQAPVGPDAKTLYARVYARTEPAHADLL